jgi:hypothetical protein
VRRTAVKRASAARAAACAGRAVSAAVPPPARGKIGVTLPPGIAAALAQINYCDKRERHYDKGQKKRGGVDDTKIRYSFKRVAHYQNDGVFAKRKADKQYHRKRKQRQQKMQCGEQKNDIRNEFKRRKLQKNAEAAEIHIAQRHMLKLPAVFQNRYGNAQRHAQNKGDRAAYYAPLVLAKKSADMAFGKGKPRFSHKILY